MSLDWADEMETIHAESAKTKPGGTRGTSSRSRKGAASTPPRGSSSSNKKLSVKAAIKQRLRDLEADVENPAPRYSHKDFQKKLVVEVLQASEEGRPVKAEWLPSVKRLHSELIKDLTPTAKRRRTAGGGSRAGSPGGSRKAPAARKQPARQAARRQPARQAAGSQPSSPNRGGGLKRKRLEEDDQLNRPSPEPLPKVLKLGSMCSGLNTGNVAFRQLHRKFEDMFAAEKEKHMRDFIEHNYDVKQIFDDCTSDEFHANAPSVDVLEAGFPCQPFSQQGKQLGVADPRCVHNHIVRYVREHEPRVVVLENVKGLLSQKHIGVLRKLVKDLEALPDEKYGGKLYKVCWKLLNSKDFNLPQNRPRVYIVAVRLMGREYSEVNYKWPREGVRKAEAQLAPLTDIFDEGPILDTYEHYPLKEAGKIGSTGRKNVAAALKAVKKKAHELGVAPESLAVIVDKAAGKPFWMVGRRQCVTKARGGSKALYSLQHARSLTLSELMRLQGFKPKDSEVNTTANQFGSALGNAFSVNVFQRVLEQALKIA